LYWTESKLVTKSSEAVAYDHYHHLITDDNEGCYWYDCNIQHHRARGPGYACVDHTSISIRPYAFIKLKLQRQVVSFARLVLLN